jgi:hypothetical protein
MIKMEERKMSLAKIEQVRRRATNSTGPAW